MVHQDIFLSLKKYIDWIVQKLSFETRYNMTKIWADSQCDFAHMTQKATSVRP